MLQAATLRHANSREFTVPTNTLSSHTALLLIDVQQGLDDPIWGPRNNPDAEQHMARLLYAWRDAGRPVIHVRHLSRKGSPLRPGQPGAEIKAVAQPLPGEPLIDKEANNAFIGTDLEARLRRDSIDSLVIVGLTTDHCVSTTARMAGDLGFTTYVAADATAAHDGTGHDGTVYPAQLIHDTALASLHGEFATVLTTDEVLAALRG
jgi:nicotinamidase-related amidase